MDLIYTDSNKNDVGVLNHYELDIAYGADENDFSLILPRSCELLESNALIYIEETESGKTVGTEYGGIIDSIKTDTANDQVTYEGRTWHGILAQKIIEPEQGYDYYEVDGDFNDVMSEIIDKLELNDFFYVDDEASGIENDQYQFERYVDAYTGIKSMLNTVNAKVKFRHESEIAKVKIYAEFISDFSTDEEWDNDRIDFTAKNNYRPVNHLICLGQGELNERAVIHLFLNEDNELQEYSYTDDPLEAEDYILDKSKQALFGIDEVTEVYDYANAEIVKNYINLESKPDNWETACDQYYYMVVDDDGTEGYNEVEWEKYQYALLENKPDDWSDCYENYYEQNADGDYETVASVEVDIYIKITRKPSDWDTKYSEYFVENEENDEGYANVDGIKKYNLLTAKPSDWDKRFKKYYKKSGNSYTSVERIATKYELTTKKPADWKNKYASYYRKTEKKHLAVEPDATYILTKEKPSDWDKKFKEYYTTDGYTYSSVQGESKSKYHLQAKCPSDWSKNYANYYYKKENAYKQIKSTAKDVYSLITEKPNKWSSTYQNYYVRTWDGVQIIYTQIGARTKYTYKKQKSSKAPSDWEENYKDYYVINKKGKYEAVSGVERKINGKKKTVAPEWKKNKYYTRYSSSATPVFSTVLESSYEKKIAYKTTKDTVPKWKKNKYYTKETSSTKAPEWEANTYYRSNPVAPEWEPNKYYKVVNDTVPEWEANTYYEYENIYAPNFATMTVYQHITKQAPTWTSGKYYYSYDWVKAPKWEDGVYYRIAYDYYKTLVDYGIEKLQGYIDADEIEVDDDLTDDYDVGDIVGATDNITGIAVWQPITKKIVKIKNGNVTLSYEIGG